MRTSTLISNLPLIALLVGCQSQSTISPNKIGKSLHRHLTAISDERPSKQALTDLCIQKYGFSIESPQASIKSAQSIRIPAYDSTTTYQIEDVTKQKKVIRQPPPQNGIIFDPIEEDVFYTEKENVARRTITTGVCIGTEYILD